MGLGFGSSHCQEPIGSWRELVARIIIINKHYDCHKYNSDNDCPVDGASGRLIAAFFPGLFGRTGILLIVVIIVLYFFMIFHVPVILLGKQGILKNVCY